METLQSCPLCQSESIQPVDSEWNFCRCGACDYFFDSPRPTLDELVAFYSQPAKYDHWVARESERDALWRRRLKKLLPYRKAGNLLDVGAGIGQFLHLARSYFSSVHGTEVSESAVRTAREKYGLVIDRGQVEEMDVPAESFDNLTLFHVLEHVPDPLKLARTCYKLLRPDGVLVVAVPNDLLAWTSKVKKAGKLLGIRAFQKFSPIVGISKAGSSREIHLSHFTPAVLRALLVKAGFFVVQESIDPYYVASGLWLATHRGYYGLHRAMFVVFRRNRYDTIWMIARKQQRAGSDSAPAPDSPLRSAPS